MAAARAPAIGIDLGTTFSCVGVYHDGRVKIIQNEHGSRTTPSVIGFVDDKIAVGEDATRAEPESMIYDVKRLIGRRYDEATIQADIKKWSFSVENDQNKPKIKLYYDGREQWFHPEELSSLVLGKMKNIAENEVGMVITKAVVTVPNYFDETQRLATKHAAVLAGLDVLRIVNEPVAAAIAYELDHPSKTDIDVLIFDLGGGTFDVAVLNIDHGIIEVIATAGNTHLGGQDFVNNMVTRLAKKIKEDLSKDVEADQNALKRLRKACEGAKISLSSEERVNIQITGLIESCDIKESFTRETLEKINKDMLDETMDSVDKVLKEAHKSKSDIDEIVLIGGATRMPYIRSLVENYFDGKLPCLSINPDEAVAYGATILAAKLNRDWPNDGSLLMDVTSLSLGIEIESEENKPKVMSKVIHRNSSLPSRKTRPYVTTRDLQTTASIVIYQGEMELVKDNRFLGKFKLTGIPPAPKGQERIEVTFDMDLDGILTVSAKHKTTGNENEITITRDKYHLEESEIKSILGEAESYYEKHTGDMPFLNASNTSFTLD